MPLACKCEIKTPDASWGFCCLDVFLWVRNGVHQRIMQKDFDLWNQQKKSLDVSQKQVRFHEAEVWWCSVGMNVGHEVCGKGHEYQRPILVLKKLSRETCIGLPISTQEKRGSWFHEISMHGKPRYVLLHQIRMLSVNRFQRRLTALSVSDFIRIKQQLEALLELSAYHHHT